MFAGCALFAVVAVIGIVGSLLPTKHSSTVRARFEQPPGLVFAAISDVSSWPSWQPNLARVERQTAEAQHPIWLMHGKFGTMPYEIVEATAPTPGRPGRYVTRIADAKLPFGGMWTWEIAEDGTGTRVTITEDGEVRSAPYRFFSRFLMGYTRTQMAVLTALGKKFGEVARPEATRLTTG
jgi:hypothetical protein